jgi:hypothetical protein
MIETKARPDILRNSRRLAEGMASVPLSFSFCFKARFFATKIIMRIMRDTSHVSTMPKRLTRLVFKIRLRPRRTSIRVQDKDVLISPGMAVAAEIETGKRRFKHVDESLALR